MKTLHIPALFMLFTLSCSSTPGPHMDTSSTATPNDGMGTIATSPTPNVEFDNDAVGSATQMDPEGDIAPIVPCKEGEIERRQSGKIVCVRGDKSRSGSTMGGR